MGKLSVKKFKSALPKSGGILSYIAIKCGVSRQAIYDFLKANPEMQELVDHEKEAILDLAENKLFDKINGGEDWAIKYLLGTKGKSRGYVQRVETELSTPDEGITINYIVPDGIKPNTKS